MVRRAVVKHKKRHHAKVRTGCATCRARRVKCNEGMPSCDNCSRLGLKCVYNVFKVWLFEQKTSTSPSATALIPPFRRNENECLDFLYFRQNTVAVLGSLATPHETHPRPVGISFVFGVDMKFFEPFWSSLIPQVALTEPAIWKLVVLLATCQRAAETSDGIRGEALSQQYGSTLSLVRREAKTPEVLALCSMLFFAFENMLLGKTNFKERLLHIKAAFDIMQEHPDNTVLNDFLVPIATQSYKLISMFLAPQKLTHAQRKQEMDISTMPGIFNGCVPAQIWLLRICKWRQTDDLDNHEPWSNRSPSFKTLRQLFMRWHSAIIRYCDQIRLHDPEEAKVAFTLVAEYHLIYAAFELSGQDEFQINPKRMVKTDGGAFVQSFELLYRGQNLPKSEIDLAPVGGTSIQLSCLPNNINTG